jgi:hypothetical protein
MKTHLSQKVALLLALALLAGAWALVIWMAVIVSHNLLETLNYIVDLAQLTP